MVTEPVLVAQIAAVQTFMEDPKQYGPPLRYRYHTFLSEPSLPAVVRVRGSRLMATTSCNISQSICCPALAAMPFVCTSCHLPEFGLTYRTCL